VCRYRRFKALVFFEITGVFLIEQAKGCQDEGENLYNVYLLDRSDKKNYSIEAVPWDEVLGYAVDKASLSTYGNVKLTCSFTIA